MLVALTRRFCSAQHARLRALSTAVRASSVTSKVGGSSFTYADIASASECRFLHLYSTARNLSSDFQNPRFTNDQSDGFGQPSTTASFGYQDVPASEKTGLVGQVFSNVASSYDLMNDLMSVGMHRLWKDKFVRDLKPFAGMKHLDVAGGTGDIAFRVLEHITQLEDRQQEQDTSSFTPAGSVTVCDINPDMLSEGRKKADIAGYDPQALHFVEGNAEILPFADHMYDAYTIAFGIRNVTHIDTALRDAYRVLKSGGRFMCLEFSHVTLPGLRQLYDAYSFNVIPEIGRAVANDKSSYEYLVESIRKFPNQDSFASMIESAGFSKVKYDNLQGGIVAIHSGFKL